MRNLLGWLETRLARNNYLKLPERCKLPWTIQQLKLFKGNFRYFEPAESLASLVNSSYKACHDSTSCAKRSRCADIGCTHMDVWHVYWYSVTLSLSLSMYVYTHSYDMQTYEMIHIMIRWWCVISWSYTKGVRSGRLPCDCPKQASS